MVRLVWLISSVVALTACAGAPPEPLKLRSPGPPRLEQPLAGPAPAPAPLYTFASERRARLETAFTAIDSALARRADESKAVGLAFALVIDGKVAHVYHHGVADKDTQTPVDSETRFRIGSITKTFTALALAKLRDDGALASLEEPLSNILPELRGLRATSTDAGPIRLRDIALHQSGLVRTGNYDESYANPVGRAEMAASLALASQTTPYQGYSYSNYGYGLLGIAVEELSGQTYNEYVQRELAKPLGLNSAAWTSASVPAAHRARSYDAKTGAPEPEWRLGALDASGGLYLSVNDVALWASFHAEAFPPRDAADVGPVKRATIRELLSVGTNDPPNDNGHAISQSPLGWDGLKACGERIFWKTGLVESFMSHVMFLPDHGVAFVSLANTRMDLYPVQSEVLAALRATGGLLRREQVVSPELRKAMDTWLTLLESYDEDSAKRNYTPEYFRFNDPIERALWMRKQSARVGKCERKAALRVDHAGAGSFQVECERAAASIYLVLDNERRLIANSSGYWRYRPSNEQREEVERLLTSLSKRKPYWAMGTAEQRASEAELGRLIRKLGGCTYGDILETRSPDEALLQLVCKGGERRRLRAVFAEADSRKLLRATVEELPPPPAKCKTW